MIKRIFTGAYRPFLFGNPHTPIATEVEVGGTIDLGHGIQGHVVSSPHGKICVVEAESGAIVGTDPVQVRKDLQDCSPEMAREQIAKAKDQARTATLETPEHFWELYDAAR